jgi:hypothetical protein
VTDLGQTRRLRAFPLLILRTLPVVLGALVLSTVIWPPRIDARELPSTLTDKAFWQLVTDSSESGGSFPSNNFVSNELAFQTVIPKLQQTVAKGGVYIGVGPDQNFTYIVGLRPKMAFIVDIRRQNMLHHLLYKAVIELSPTRADYLSRLFGRAKPKDVAANAPAEALLTAFSAQEPDEQMYQNSVREVLELLIRKHRFTLDEDDTRVIEYIYRAFFEYGPEITYAPVAAPSFGGRNVRIISTPYPSFAELQMQSDGTGTNRAYLANEGNYGILREMQLKNLIVPIVGDFAGPKALRAVGRFVRERGGKVTSLYTSNVEQYLFQNQVWKQYYTNVSTLPLDSTSTFIRAYFPRNVAPQIVYRGSGQSPAYVPPPMPAEALNMRLPSVTRLCSAKALIAAVEGGDIAHYFDVVEFGQGK